MCYTLHRITSFFSFFNLFTFLFVCFFWIRELVITIYSKAAQEEFRVYYFSLRTKVYKMRFDSSTFYSIIGVVPFSRKYLHSTSVLSEMGP